MNNNQFLATFYTFIQCSLLNKTSSPLMYYPQRKTWLMWIQYRRFLYKTFKYTSTEKPL